MLEINTLMLMLMLALALRTPRRMEWLSASIVAFAMALLALTAEWALVDLSTPGRGGGHPARTFAAWFGLATFLCARLAWSDIRRSVGRKGLGQSCATGNKKRTADH